MYTKENWFLFLPHGVEFHAKPRKLFMSSFTEIFVENFTASR